MGKVDELLPWVEVIDPVPVVVTFVEEVVVVLVAVADPDACLRNRLPLSSIISLESNFGCHEAWTMSEWDELAAFNWRRAY